MAGSYNHVVVTQSWVDDPDSPLTADDLGKLLDSETVQSMLDCCSGDVSECIEEMYGMIHYLAHVLSLQTPHFDRAWWVEQARLGYKAGLAFAGVTPWDEA